MPRQRYGLLTLWASLIVTVAGSSGKASEPAPSAAPGITVQQVIDWTLLHSEYIGIAEAKKKAAEARTSAAWRRLGPTATLSGTWTHRSQAAATIGQQTDALAANGEVSVDLWNPAAAPLLRAARYLEKAQTLSSSLAQRDLAFAAAEAYLSASVAQLELQAALERVSSSTQAVSEAESRYRSGMVAEDVLLQFELNLALTQAYADGARTALRRALSVLQLLTHQPIEADQIAAIITDVTTDPVDLNAPSSGIGPSAGREEVAMYDARIGAARAQSREPRLRIIPSLSATARYRASTEFSLLGLDPTWTLEATARWPLWDGGVRYAEARAARADVEVLELERSAYVRQLESDLSLARAEIDDAQANLVAARKRHALARRHDQSTALKFRAGLASSLERSEAYATALEAQANLAQAAARAASARNTYAQALGHWPYGWKPQHEEAQP